jgi:hypothetical protein
MQKAFNINSMESILDKIDDQSQPNEALLEEQVIDHILSAQEVETRQNIPKSQEEKKD